MFIRVSRRVLFEGRDATYLANLSTSSLLNVPE
jgi:hypothetical protein